MQNNLHERAGDASRILLGPVLLQSPFGPQAVLYREVVRDDLVLLGSGEGEWFRAVLQIEWKPLRPIAAKYYQALWEFNIEAARKRGQILRLDVTAAETHADGVQRLLLERLTTGNAAAPILYPTPTPPLHTPTVNANRLEPGVVPMRIAGRMPKCFFALVKAFIGVHLMGKSGSAAEVEHHLRVSPPFARACGFTLPDPDVGYRHTDIPALRKLEQFEEIMAARGLWDQIRTLTVRENLAVLSTGPDGIPLDAVAMSDAASHDSNALVPHFDRLFATYPELKGKFSTVLADSAWDDAEIKQVVEERFGLSLKTPVNPRSIKPVTVDLGRGMKSLSPAGTLICQADQEMSYEGSSYQRETFIYHPPSLGPGEVACLSCPLRDSCCRSDNTKGRQVEIPFTKLPHIDPSDPPMTRRFKAIMRRRTAVERAIKRIKIDFGDDKLTRRGNDAFQAHLDRSLIAFHLMLRLNH